jgi:hypothetical protein
LTSFSNSFGGHRFNWLLRASARIFYTQGDSIFGAFFTEIFSLLWFLSSLFDFGVFRRQGFLDNVSIGFRSFFNLGFNIMVFRLEVVYTILDLRESVQDCVGGFASAFEVVNRIPLIPRLFWSTLVISFTRNRPRPLFRWGPGDVNIG